MTRIDPDALTRHLRDSERALDGVTLARLAQARSTALQVAPWYRSLALWVPTGAVALSAMLFVLPQNPTIEAPPVERAETIDENLQMMLDGPEFYLWASRQVNALET